MSIQHVLEFLGFQIASWFLRLLPFRTVSKLGAGIGQFVFDKLRYRRSVALNNLRHAFPEKSESDIEIIAREAFRSVGAAFFEVMWSPRLDAAKVRQVMKFENPELLAELTRRGKGIILLTGHFGNWELLAQGIAVAGFPMTIVVKTQSNRLIDKRINSWRAKFGNHIVRMEHAVREALRTLQGGGMLGIIADQAAAKESIWVPFFGREVPTYEGPAALSLKTGAAIVIGFPVRQSDGTYLTRFTQLSTADMRGTDKESVAELTRRHVNATEEIIRQNPGQWMWMHKRWKHLDSASNTNHARDGRKS